MDTNAQYMLDMFPKLGSDEVHDILAKNRNSLERSIDEALTVLALTEENEQVQRTHSASEPPGIRRAASNGTLVRNTPTSIMDVPHKRPSTGIPIFYESLKDTHAPMPRSDSLKPKVGGPSSGRGCPMQLSAGFLEVPKTRIVIEEIRKHYIDFVIYIYKKNTTKVGIALCRCDGFVTLYSVNSSLLCHRHANCAIASIEPGDVLQGVNHEFFGKDTSIDHISAVLAHTDRVVSLHLRRWISYSAKFPTSERTEHPMVKHILRAYKSPPAAFTNGFSDILGHIRRKLIEWDDGYIHQKIPNKVLQKSSEFKAGVSSLITPIVHGRDHDDDPSISPARLNEQSHHAGRSASAPRQGGPILSSFPPALQTIELRASWKQNVKVYVNGLRPALSVRVGKAVQHRNNGLVEYSIRVTDVLTGCSWSLTKFYSDFSDLKKQLFDISPDLFAHLPLLSKTSHDVAQQFLSSLIAILETALLTFDIIRTYHVAMAFLEVNERISLLNSMMSRQNLTERLRRRLEALAHNALQTPQLRELLSLGISACRSLLDADVSVIKKSRTSRMTLYDESGRSYLRDYESVEALLSAFASNDVTSLRTASKWLSSMQDLLLSGLMEDMKALSASVISRHVNRGQSGTSNGLEDASKLPKADVLSCLSSEKDVPLFDQLRDHPSPSSRQSIITALDDISMLQQWLEDKQYMLPTDDFILPLDVFIPFVREAIRRQIEMELFVPLENQIRLIISEKCCDVDCMISENLLKIKTWTQSAFGIPETIQSPSNWADVAVMLRYMFSQSIPFDRIHALKAAVKEIPIVYERERAEREKLVGRKSPLYIGADDMLPIFIYLLATSELPFGLFSFSYEVDNFCDEKLKMSETGYILATFAASVHHLAEGGELGGHDATVARGPAEKSIASL